MKIIILAGGGGTRLFPLSRHSFPKQFLKLGNGKSLLAQTIERFLLLVAAKDIVVITNRDYLYHVQNELSECNAQDSHILLEPSAKNTAPAIALAVQYCCDVLQCPNDEALLIAAADHVIKPKEVFIQCLRKSLALVECEKVVTFGVKPTKPEIGYGYIEAGAAFESGYVVTSFKEKPSLAVACQYVEDGNYYWNSGMFAFKIKVILEELTSYQPEIIKCLGGSYAEALKNFVAMPSISIDYAVAEHSQRVVVVPLSCYWNDIGSWDAMYEVLGKDESGNALQGDCVTIDCKNSLIMGRDRLIAGIGLDDLLLVETDDVIVVAKKGESQKVKDIVEELKGRGRREVAEHTTIFREWGSVSLLGEGARYKMKKFKVKPAGKLCMQMHYHRSEHWIVLSGTAKVTIEDNVSMVHENESVFIPQTTKYKIENPGKIPLEIIEVQNGNYVGEDDIVIFSE